MCCTPFNIVCAPIAQIRQIHTEPGYRRDDSHGHRQDIDQVAPGEAVSTKRNHSEVGAPKNERHNSIFVYKAQGKKYVSTTKLVVEPVREINLLTSLLHVGPKAFFVLIYSRTGYRGTEAPTLE